MQPLSTPTIYTAIASPVSPFRPQFHVSATFMAWASTALQPICASTNAPLSIQLNIR